MLEENYISMNKNKQKVSRLRSWSSLGVLSLVLSLFLMACGDNTATTAPAATTAAASATTAAASATTAAASATTAAAGATTAAAGATTAAAGATTAAASATTAAAAGAPAKTGGILKVGVSQDAVGFDPHLTNATASYRVLENVYSGLLRFNEKLEITPDLATEYTQTDPTTYTFKLRKGVKFHNGREVKASDVTYSLNRIKDPATASPRAGQLAQIASMETPDEYTIVIKLKAPFSPLLAVLADVTTAIVPKETVDANGGKMDKVADGTGPFKLVEYVPNTRIRLEKNANYYVAGKPYLDGITFQPIPDDTARSTAVRTGAVDLIEYAPPKDLSILKQDSKITVTGDANNNVRFLALNTKVKPFDNVKVRQAIAWAIDRQQVLDAAVNGAGTPLVAGPFVPSFWPGLQQPIYKQDLAKAKALLAEAGYPNGFTAKLKNTPTYSFLGNAGIVVQEQLKAIGINFEIVSQEWSVFLKDYLSKDFEAAVSGYSGFVDPDRDLSGTYVTGKQNNFMSYSNPEFDKLIEQAASVSDQAQRAKLYQQAQTILATDAPMVFLYAANQYEAMQSYVKGYLHYPNGSHLSFREVSLNK
jgi:peptide/nickel transport system substrate-binding protein